MTNKIKQPPATLGEKIKMATPLRTICKENYIVQKYLRGFLTVDKKKTLKNNKATSEVSFILFFDLFLYSVEDVCMLSKH